MQTDNTNSKENILANFEKIDFDALTPSKERESTLMMKVDKDVHKMFSIIAGRRGQTIKAMGNKCVLDFLKKCKQDLEEGL